MYAALDDAVAHYGGDLLIYFYEQGDASSQQIESVVFADARISAYLNENFGRLAVEIVNETWEALMKRYRPENPADWPYVLVDLRRSFTHLDHHGWENVRDADDLEAILEWFKYAKEVGWMRL